MRDSASQASANRARTSLATGATPKSAVTASCGRPAADPTCALGADGQWVTNVGAGAGGEPKFEIVDAAGQKTVCGEHVPAQGARRNRYPARRWTDRDHIAETCRRTHRAAEIGAVGERGHSGRDRDGRTARRASRKSARHRRDSASVRTDDLCTPRQSRIPACWSCR